LFVVLGLLTGAVEDDVEDLNWDGDGLGGSRGGPAGDLFFGPARPPFEEFGLVAEKLSIRAMRRRRWGNGPPVMSAQRDDVVPTPRSRRVADCHASGPRHA
jgi:hypothetical protein